MAMCAEEPTTATATAGGAAAAAAGGGGNEAGSGGGSGGVPMVLAGEVTTWCTIRHNSTTRALYLKHLAGALDAYAGWRMVYLEKVGGQNRGVLQCGGIVGG
jgi:hypothetical protein